MKATNISAVVTLGPLAFSAGVIALLAGVIVAFAIDGWLRQRGRVSVESALWLSLLLALVVARVVFVMRGYPSTLFLDAQGHLRDVHMGELSAATLAESLGHVTDSGPSFSGESP